MILSMYFMSFGDFSDMTSKTILGTSEKNLLLNFEYDDFMNFLNSLNDTLLST